ncbi:hypothetical protein Glove_410g11 [Diversispora epigaea]|uniref:Uncharacterized protein n=1 Tax=Diversispora epigaea TaxID=1348612 RepID=A0A397GYC1_9GLOM|nr:hypothetical protein Glove_410g11 [Diversispora epigaea]
MGQWRLELIAIEIFIRCRPAGAKVRSHVFQRHKPKIRIHLILAALVLEQGLKKGYRPSIGGKRRVTPGSLPIIAKLHRLGLVKFYEQAGFEIRTPGCSYEGEIWLSAIENLASTATVAASSIEMKIKDPRELLDLIDPEKYKEFLEQWFDQADPNNPSFLGSYLPPLPPSFTGSINYWKGAGVRR